MNMIVNGLSSIASGFGNITGLTGGNKVGVTTPETKPLETLENKPPNKKNTERFKQNLEKFEKLISKTQSKATAALDLAGSKLTGNKVHPGGGHKPALSALAGMGAGLGLNPAMGAGPAQMGGVPLQMANTNAHLNADSVSSTAAVQEMTMGQMGQIMQLQMKSQTEMALMKQIATLNEAMSKEIKKAAEGVKNLAG